MHGQEIFQVFTDLNHSDLGLCTGYHPGCSKKVHDLTTGQYTFTLWFPCLDGQTKHAGKLRALRKALEHEPKASDFRAFFNSSNFLKCLDQAIQTRKP